MRAWTWEQIHQVTYDYLPIGSEYWRCAVLHWLQAAAWWHRQGEPKQVAKTLAWARANYAEYIAELKREIANE